MLRHLNKPKSVGLARGARLLQQSKIYAAVGKSARQLQYQELLKIALHDAELGNSNLKPCKYFPTLYPLGSSELWEWFRGLKDGADVVAYVNGMGKTFKSQASAKANRDKFGEKNRYDPHNPNDFSKFFSQNDVMNFNVICTAILSLSTFNSIQKIKNYRKFTTSILFCFCQSCNQLVMSCHSSSHHHCLVDNSIQTIPVNLNHFPYIQRCFYIHDLLSIPFIATLIGNQQDGKFIFHDNVAKKVGFSHFIRLHALDINSKIPPNSPPCYIYIKPDDISDSNWKLTLAVDSASSILSSPPSTCPMATGEDLVDIPWRQDSMKKVYDLLGESIISCIYL
jgi:hypothetical protein